MGKRVKIRQLPTLTVTLPASSPHPTLCLPALNNDLSERWVYETHVLVHQQIMWWTHNTGFQSQE
jgi:hypothetical protein